VGIVFFLLCFRLVLLRIRPFRFFSIRVYFAVMFVLFVKNVKSFSLDSIVACTSLDCTIESVMVDVCPWWSEVQWKAFDFSSIDL
jgi:hypothetical protein